MSIALVLTLLGWLLIVAGAAWLLGPTALIAGGVVVTGFGLFAVRVDRR